MCSPSASVTTSSLSRLSSASENCGQLIDPQPPLLALAHLKHVAVTGSPGSILFFTPSSPEANMTPNARYGFARRIRHPDLDTCAHAAPRRHAHERERLRMDQATFTGAS